jgi:PAS domain S-box-containing protein
VEELAALYALTNVLYRSRSLPEVLEAGLDAIVRVLGSRASILLFDRAGVMQFVAWRGLSEDYRKTLAGHTPWGAGDLDPEPIFVPDIRLTDEPDWIKRGIVDEGIIGLAFIPLLSAGRVIGKFMTYYGEAHAFDDSEKRLALTIARQIGFSLEKFGVEEARHAAEEELRESEARFRVMAEEAPVMIWTSDAMGRCLYLNAQLREFWGVEDLDGFSWGNTMHPEDTAAITDSMIAATLERRPVEIEGRYRNAAGEYRTLRTRARPRLSPGGEFLGMIGVNVDITERKKSDAQRDLLLAELNHRVKNTLAVVQGIAHQTFKNGSASAAARTAFEGRLLALSNAHSLLTHSNWENARIDRIAIDTFSNQGVDPERVRIAGPKVELPARQALGLSLGLHELCTNALKYGALSVDTGRIDVAWRLEPGVPPAIHMTWTESGGPSVVPPDRSGFGSRLIGQVLSNDLDGTVSMAFEPTGLVCTILAPLPTKEQNPQ